jgi:hypothetical protein
MDIMIAMKSIFRLVNKTQTLIRSIHNIFKIPLAHLSYTIKRMRRGSRYYSQRSSYTELFSDIYDLLLEESKRHTHDNLLRRLVSVV